MFTFEKTFTMLPGKLYFTLLSLLFVVVTMNCTAQDSKKFRFVFMTDIHITPKNHAVEGFTKAIEVAENLNPDFIVTGGDLIMDALAQKYSRADSLYNLYLQTSAKFKKPVYNCMGNHEIWGWDPKNDADTTNSEYGKGMYAKRINPAWYSVDLHGWHFIFLSSIQRDYSGQYTGGIDKAQLEWIKNDLAKIYKSTPVAVITHIPFITLEAQYYTGALAACGPWEVITNSRETLDLFKGHNLKLVLQGHLHYYEKMEIAGTTFITGGSIAGAWWTGPYRDTQEGFVVIDADGKDFSAKYFDYGWEPVK